MATEVPTVGGQPIEETRRYQCNEQKAHIFYVPKDSPEYMDGLSPKEHRPFLSCPWCDSSATEIEWGA